jgi:hypothetical protein
VRFVIGVIGVLVFCSAAGASQGQWHARGNALRGDLDGNGRAEAVVIEQRGHACVFRLVAGSLEARLHLEICDAKPGELTSGPDPHVAALAPIDRHRGLEVVVQLGHGAYMEFADLWTVRRGALRRFAGPWYSARNLHLRLVRTRSVNWRSDAAPPYHEFREPQPFPTCAATR